MLGHLQRLSQSAKGRAAIAVVCTIAMLQCYSLVNRTFEHKIDFMLPIDEMIPFMPWTVFVYQSLYIMVLVAAIVCEVIATSFLQQSQQFSRFLPTVLMALFYGAAFYLLSFTLRAMPVGVAYAIWSGLGIVLISGIGYFVFRQTLDIAAVIGLGFIVTGGVIVNVFSKTVGH